MSRIVDRGAIFAGWVGVGMAIVIAVSFLLVIPIEPAFWLLSPLAGVLIGYYANQRSERVGGPWPRILANGLYAGLLTGITLVALLLVVKLVFFSLDDGYRDATQGGRLACSGGADCVYARYLAAEGAADRLARAGVTDVASFSSFYWRQQLETAGQVLVVTIGGAFLGALLFGLTHRRPAGSEAGPAPASPLSPRT